MVTSPALPLSSQPVIGFHREKLSSNFQLHMHSSDSETLRDLPQGPIQSLPPVSIPPTDPTTRISCLDVLLQTYDSIDPSRDSYTKEYNLPGRPALTQRAVQRADTGIPDFALRNCS